MDNKITLSLRRIAYLLLLIVAILLVYISYLQIIASDKLAAHPLNRRTVELERRVERGVIYDRTGEKLAYSIEGPGGVWQREYPLGAIAAHITGYISERYGLAGLEGVYNRQLSGLANPEQRLGAVARLWPSQGGASIVLTIDSELQKTAWKALGARRGAVVAMNPQTGAILALVSRPSFDPSSVDIDWSSIASSQDSPLINRAAQGLYPPGSIIKILVAEAALKEKVAEITTSFLCKGKLAIGQDYVLHEANNHAHGKVDLEEALAVSCNVTFGQLAMQLGRGKMAKAYEKYGFAQASSSELIDLPARLPEFSRLSEGDLAQAGIGQGSLLVTPLKMAMLASVFANKGVMMRPYVVQKILSPSGVTEDAEPSVFLKPVDQLTANLVRKMMVAVVNEGTGSAAQLSRIQVAGKTGTAENPHGESHAWFIGFAPADNPQVAIAVIVENGGSGGAVAAPIARQVLAQAL